MKTIKWGIIGCGDVCEVKSGPAFYKADGSELVAVMRRDAAKAEDFAKRHSVPRWYTSADELLSSDYIDAVYIATPPSTHLYYALKAIKAGKATYVEKPMALTFGECQQMVEAAKVAEVPLFVAHYRRALPYFEKVKELVDGGAIGTPLHVDIKYFRTASESDKSAAMQTWRVDPTVAGGGYLLDLAPHTIDIVELIVGKIADVKGFTANIGGYYNAEDTVVASFCFEGGALGSARWCFVADDSQAEDRVVISGARGSITFSTFDFTPVVLVNDLGTQSFEFDKPAHIQQPFIQTIVDELRGVGVCLCRGDEGARPSWFFDKLFGRI